MKAGAKLRNHTIIILTLMLFVAGVTLAGGKCYALNPQEEIQASAIGYAYTHYGEEQAFLEIQSYQAIKPGSPSSAVIQQLVNAGAFPNHVEELKAMGYTDVDYSAVSGSSSTTSQTETTEPASVPEPTPEPAAFTVEDMEDTPMWATQVVNYRDGASTEYNKIGSLEQYEQVTVNGAASTGWYRFNTSDGTTAYVSDSYLTTEDPGNRELNIYNEETEQVDTYIFEDEDPEVIDEAIEDIKEEYEDKEPEVAEPEPEEITEPEPVEEPVTEPAEEGASHPWQFYAFIVFAIFCVVVICICVYYMVRNKKRGRVDW